MAILPIFVLEELKGGNQHVGLITAVFFAASVIFRPLGGIWVDSIGRKKTLVFSLAFFAGLTFVYADIHSLLVFLILRFVHGMTFGTATVAAGTIAADLIPDGRKGEGVGYFTTFMNLAMVIGPFFALSLLDDVSFYVLFMIVFGLSLLSFLLGSLVQIPFSKTDRKGNKARASLLHSVLEPGALPASISIIFITIAYSGINTFIPVYAKSLQMAHMANYFFVLFALIIVLSRPWTGKLFDRMGDHITIYPCMFFYAAGLIVLSQAHTPFLFLASGAMIALGHGTLYSCLQVIAIKSSPDQRRGSAISTYLLFSDAGVGIGSLLLAWVAESMDYSAMYLVSSAAICLALMSYFGLYHRNRKMRKIPEVTIHE
jgi:MFS family permease